MDLEKTTSCERDHSEELEDGRVVLHVVELPSRSAVCRLGSLPLHHTIPMTVSGSCGQYASTTDCMRECTYRYWRDPRCPLPGRLPAAAAVEFVLIEHHPWRVDDLQPALKLHRLELLRVPVSRGDGTHLGALERVDEAALADVWVLDGADGDALRRGLVRFRETKVRGCGGGEIGALVRRGLEWKGRRR